MSFLYFLMFIDRTRYRFSFAVGVDMSEVDTKRNNKDVGSFISYQFLIPK